MSRKTISEKYIQRATIPSIQNVQIALYHCSGAGLGLYAGVRGAKHLFHRIYFAEELQFHTFANMNLSV